ncbi:MAG: SCP2 sterol-binding domain-containing protein [Chloroflexota bacterium]
MDLYPRVLAMRAGARAWFAAMQAPEHGFGVHYDSAFHRKANFPGMLLPGSYNAAHCLFLLGAYDAITPLQADSLAGFLNRFQRQDGAYRIPEMVEADIYYPDFEYIDLHTSNYTLGALALLGRSPARPLAFMQRYDTPEKLARWLSARQMAEPWSEGNYIVNLASFYAYLLENGEQRYRPRLEQLLEWHAAHQDPASGYWYDPSTRDLTSAMAGAAHNLHLYYYLNRPIPRFEKMVDHCLGILEGVSSACLDIDVVDILANLHLYGYRQAEIEAYLERKLAALLDFQNPDGGFADTCEGIRLFDGWQRYQEPQGLSNTFATWFRCATIGMICYVLYPAERQQWRFRNTLGMGYFNPRPPASQPVSSRAQDSSEVSLPDKASLGVNIPTVAAAPPPFGAEAEKLLARVRHKLSTIDPARLAALGAEAIYQIEITGAGGGTLNITITGSNASVEAGDNPQARVCLSTSADAFGKLLDGKLNATVAYMTKKLKIRGDIALAMKLESLLR